MTSRRNLFVVVVVLLLLVLYLLSILLAGNIEDEVAMPAVTPPEESVNTDITFADDAKKYDEVVIVTQSEEDRANEAVKTQEEAATTTEVSDTLPETETATSTPIPTARITVSGEVTEGTLGSYCWEELCVTALIDDLPYPGIAVATTSSFSYSFDTEIAPERVMMFLKPVGSTEVVLNQELSFDETRSGTITIDSFTGEYILMVTGVFPGGKDVAHAFKIALN